MAAALPSPERPHQNGILSEDWPEVHLDPRASVVGGHTTFREQHGMDTEVQVTDDGRYDIQIHKHKPRLVKLINFLERDLKPCGEDRRPSVSPAAASAGFCLRLNIVIHVVGSHGDVQPFVALGKELQEYGHRVRLATHLSFREYVNESGLEFFNIGGDPAQLMAFMVSNPNLLPGMQAIRHGDILKRRREMKTIFSGCWRSCFETGDGTGLHQIPQHPSSESLDNSMRPFVADVIIANPPSFAHVSCAEKLGIPLNLMFTMPWTATQAFPHPLANIRLSDAKESFANFSSYAIVSLMLWEGLGDLINLFRKRELGLDPLDAIRIPSMAHQLQVPHTYLWSPSLLPKPRDWADNIDVCGFQFMHNDSKYKPPDDLDVFLKSGEPPIYIGFGSIVVDDPAKLTKTIFDAVRITGKRALVSKGWGNIGAGEAEVPDNILLLGKVPHDWLFQHVSCVVHHGGAGTTAAGLINGRPTVIVPFFGDQPFWGSIVARAGAGPLPVPYKQLTAEKLAAAINKALEPSTLEKAEEIGKGIRREQGVQNAARSFHRNLNIETLQCSICPGRPAVWRVRHSNIKLSAFAATILVEAELVKPQSLELYRSQEYDTSRDPKGPISASIEVLYGFITDLLSGMVCISTETVKMISGNHHHYSAKHSSHRHVGNRDWVKDHCTACLEMDERRKREKSELVNDIYDNRPQGENIDLESVRSNHHSAEEASAQRNADITFGDNYDIGEGLSVEQTLTRERTQGQYADIRVILGETEYHTKKLVKQALNFAITLPTDLTLSLTKGFHNAPKLYHDTTVQDLPRVTDIKSGFRAAGTEFAQGFYYGITGLLSQPAQGYQKSGVGGLVKGIGKGFGSMFLKPAASTWGLAGFPLDGLHKRLRNSLAKTKTNDILRARLSQGIAEMCAASTAERAVVITKWRELEKRLQQTKIAHSH